MPRISVIIPVFNRRHTLLRALNSVRAQTRPVDEIIVIDDGSTDGTAEWVRGNCPDVTLIEQPNRGVSAARNVGIARAQGDWIAFLDSDDEWLPEKIERQLSHLQQAGSQEVDNRSIYRLCHTDEIWIRNGKRVNPMHKHAKSGGWIFERCLPMCVISPSSALIRRDLFIEAGLFDETLPACEDYDLWLRICYREPVLYVDTRLLVKYGGHEDQLSRKYWGMDRFRIHAMNKLLQHNGLTTAQRDCVCQQMLFKLEVLMQGASKRNQQGDVQMYQTMRHQLETQQRISDISTMMASYHD